jgi:hypothetical protein
MAQADSECGAPVAAVLQALTGVLYNLPPVSVKGHAISGGSEEFHEVPW